MLLENRFMLTYRSKDFFKIRFVTFWSAVALLLHADWIMLKNASNQGRVNCVTVFPWHTEKLHFSKNYSAVSTSFDIKWIFDWLPREQVSTFQFILWSIWKPGDSNFWVKICLAQHTVLSCICQNVDLDILKFQELPQMFWETNGH